jgi:hypothetical protein
MPQRTLVLVSTDGGAYGGAGAQRFAEVSPHAEGAIAAVVLDGIAGRGRPRLAIAGDAAVSPARVLVETASTRIAEQTGREPVVASVGTQLADLGIPFAFDEQGRLLKQGIATVTLTTHDPGEPEAPAGDAVAPLSTDRFTRLGRATESLVGSIDGSVGGAFPTHDSLFLDDRAASGWAVRLTLIVAVVPFVLGVLDLLVRARRMSLPLKPAARALRTRILFWLFLGLLVWLGAFAGAFPTGDALPLPPYSQFVEDPPIAGLALLGIALAMGWLVLRRRIAPPYDPSPGERLAGYASGLTALGALALVVALTRPYGLFFLLPSLYAWLWLPLFTRLWARAVVYLAGLLGPLIGLALLSNELGLGATEVPLYVVGLATVGYVPATWVLLWLVWGAVAAQLGALAFGRYVPYERGAEPPRPGLVRATISQLPRAGRRQSD